MSTDDTQTLDAQGREMERHTPEGTRTYHLSPPDPAPIAYRFGNVLVNTDANGDLPLHVWSPESEAWERATAADTGRIVEHLRRIAEAMEA